MIFNLFEWGEKRFARGIAKAMKRSYLLYKARYPELNEYELIKRALADRPGEPAEQLLSDLGDINFYDELGGNLKDITYFLVRIEYIQSMHDTLDEESEKTNKIFRDVISEVMANY